MKHCFAFSLWSLDTADIYCLLFLSLFILLYVCHVCDYALFPLHQAKSVILSLAHIHNILWELTRLRTNQRRLKHTVRFYRSFSFVLVNAFPQLSCRFSNHAILSHGLLTHAYVPLYLPVLKVLVRQSTPHNSYAVHLHVKWKMSHETILKQSKFWFCYFITKIPLLYELAIQCEGFNPIERK